MLAVLLVAVFALFVAGALAWGGLQVWSAVRQRTGEVHNAGATASAEAVRQLEEERRKLARELANAQEKEQALQRELGKARDEAERAQLRLELERALQSRARSTQRGERGTGTR